MSNTELDRLKVVNRYLKLDIHKENELQEIVALAARICDAPIGLISFIEDDTNIFRFRVGTEIESVTNDESFCVYTVQQTGVLEINDTLLDLRFANKALVTGTPNVRFYAGAPLTTHDGHNLGTLCVVDTVTKQLTDTQRQMLLILAKQIINLLEFDASLRVFKQLYNEAKSSEIKLRSFFESSKSCHCLIGEEYKIIAYNKAFANFIKKIYNIDADAGMLVTDLIHEPYRTYFIENYHKALNGIATYVEREIVYTDETIWWFIAYEPAHDPDGKIIGVSFNATDITQRLKQEQKVISQNESLKKIAFLHSHELRKPVASILGLINVFKLNNYHPTKQEILMMEQVTTELDEKIRKIIGHTD